MKCWRCGKDIVNNTSECVYCHAPQQRSTPVTVVGSALRQLYDRYGAEMVLTNPVILANGLGDVIADTLYVNVQKLKGQLKMAMDAGMGRFYFQQLAVGKPDTEFESRIRILLTEDVGFNKQTSADLMGYFDEMIGWKAVNPVHTSVILPPAPAQEPKTDTSAKEERIYEEARKDMSADNLSGYEDALRLLQQISDRKEAAELAEICRQRIKDLKRKRSIPLIIILFLLLSVSAWLFYRNEKEKNRMRLILSQNQTATMSAIIQKEKINAANTATAVMKTTQSAALTATKVFYLRQTEEISVMRTRQSIQATQTKLAEPTKTPTRTPSPTPTKTPTRTPSPTPTKTPTRTPSPTPSLRVGSRVYFGHYEQDNNRNNGQEQILWEVLSINEKEKRALLISVYGLDAQPYNRVRTSVTWENSDLREWLNSTFIQNAFTTSERNHIKNVTIANTDKGYSSGQGGRNTTDRIFLLSKTGARQYYSSDYDRKCPVTAYARARSIANGATTAIRDGYGIWWLRSPGNTQMDAAVVETNGSVLPIGKYVSADTIIVRPVFWYDLR